MKLSKFGILALQVAGLMPSCAACLRRLAETDSPDDDSPLVPLTLRVGIVPGTAPVFLDDNLSTGYLADWLKELQCVAEATPGASDDGLRYDLQFDFVALEGDLSTYNGALATLTDGCENVATGCLDMLAGDYFITAERTEIVSFPPQPFSATFVTGYRLQSNADLNSIEDVNAANGSVCLLEDSAIDAKYGPLVDNKVPCGPTTAACAKLLADGGCDFGVGGAVYVGFAAQSLEGIDFTGPPLADKSMSPTDLSYIATPLRSSLDPNILQNLNLWSDEAAAIIPELVEEYFGQDTLNQLAEVDATNDEVSISLNAALYEHFPYVFKDEETGLVQGLLIDYARSLEEISDGKLNVVVTGVDDGDRLFSEEDNTFNPTGTYNGAIDGLDASPFDILIGDFTATPERQQSVTFPYRYATYFITLFKLESSPFNSLEEANAAGGSICFKGGTAFSREDYMAVSDSLVECTTFDDCYTKLAESECDFVPDIIPDGFVNAANAIPNVTVVPTFENIFDSTFFSALPLRSDLSPSHYVLLDGWVHEAREAGVLPNLFKKWFAPFITSDDAKEKMGMMEGIITSDELDGVEDPTSSGSWIGFGTSATVWAVLAGVALLMGEEEVDDEEEELAKVSSRR